MGSAASTSVKEIEINKENRLASDSCPETPVRSSPRQSSSSGSSQTAVAKLPQHRPASADKQHRATSAEAKEEKSGRARVAELKVMEQEATGQEEFLGQGSMLQTAALEKQVAMLESEKLDLQDHIAELKERVLEAQTPPTPRSNAHALQQALSHAELRIAQLEEELSATQAQANLQTGKLRRKVKKLTAQLTAAKQEASVRQLEISDDLSSLREENESLKALLERQVDRDAGDDACGGRMKVILELSTQMSEQSSRMAELELVLAEREQEIAALRGVEGAQGRPGNPAHRPPSGSKPWNPARSDPRGSTTRPGGRGQGEEGGHKGGKAGRVGSASSFLSDSDSDWDPTGPSSKIHSAPPGCRATTALNTHKPPLQPTEEDTWSVDGDATTEANYEADKSHRRSVLKARQAKERDQRALGLLGPTLAFGSLESPDLVTPEASTARMDFDSLHGSPLMPPISTM